MLIYKSISAVEGNVANNSDRTTSLPTTQLTSSTYKYSSILRISDIMQWKENRKQSNASVGESNFEVRIGELNEFTYIPTRRRNWSSGSFSMLSYIFT